MGTTSRPVGRRRDAGSGRGGRPRRAARLTGASALLFVLAAGAAGCDESVADLAGPTDIEATFSSIQTGIFEGADANGRPPCTDCHNPRTAVLNGDLDLSHDAAYANLVGVASRGKSGAIRVIAGDGANSYLIHKLEGRSDIAGLRMPISGPYLTTDQIAVIRRWIDLGARRD